MRYLTGHPIGLCYCFPMRDALFFSNQAGLATASSMCARIFHQTKGTPITMATKNSKTFAEISSLMLANAEAIVAPMPVVAETAPIVIAETTPAPIAPAVQDNAPKLFRVALKSYTDSHKPSKEQKARGVTYGRFIVGGASNGLWLEKHRVHAYGTDAVGPYVIVTEKDIERVKLLKDRTGIDLAYVPFTA